MKETKSNYCELCGDFHDIVQEHVSLVKVGQPIPDFEFEACHDGKTKEMSFSRLRGKWAVIVFYPADFAPACAAELAELAERYPEFQAAGAEIVSISTDTVYAHEAWRDASKRIKEIPFPMASDPAGRIAAAFGVLVENDEPEHVQDEGLAQSGTFIVDSSGTLRSMDVADGSVGRSAAETLRKLKAAR